MIPWWQVERFIGTVDDVTEKIELAAAKRGAEMAVLAAETRARAERDVTAYVFHEFRSDLQVVTNAVEFWNDGEDVSDRLKKAARRSLAHCSSLVENIMDFTKLKAGKMVLDNAPFDLSDVCEKVLETMEHQFPDLADQRVYAPPGVCVAGSPRHLTQVLQNLMPVHHHYGALCMAAFPQHVPHSTIVATTSMYLESSRCSLPTH